MANISTLSTPLGSVANLTDQLFNNSDINGYMTDATITIPISVLNQDWTGLAFRIYNLVGTLWTMAFLNGAAFMTIAFVTESYYFSHPEDKSVSGGPGRPCGITWGRSRSGLSSWPSCSSYSSWPRGFSPRPRPPRTMR